MGAGDVSRSDVERREPVRRSTRGTDQRGLRRTQGGFRENGFTEGRWRIQEKPRLVVKGVRYVFRTRIG